MTTEKELKLTIDTLKLARSLKTVFSFLIVMATALFIISGAAAILTGTDFFYRLAAAGGFCFFCFYALFISMKYAAKKLKEELEEMGEKEIVE